MTRREIFYIVSLACLGVFILLGAYLLKENVSYSNEMQSSKEFYAGQTEELKKEGKKPKASQANPVKAPSTNPVSIATDPTTTTATGNVQNMQPDSAPQAALKSNSFITPGCKVGDIVKLGDVEMIVTKSTARHKVIDITLKGNTPEQPPKLILTENNRIVYEIPADVDVNMDVTEKTTIDKSPIFYGEQKAGK